MRKIPPHYLFILGSILLLIITTVYYFAIPRFEYFGKGYSIYSPGASLPERLPNEYAVSNVYLLLKYAKYLVVYMGAFVVLYLIAGKIERLKFAQIYVRLHLIFATLAFILLIYLNPYLIIPQNISGYLSDVYIGVEFAENQMLEINQFVLWYSSLQTASSIIGIVMCLLGSVVFFVGIFRGWNKGASVGYESRRQA